VKIKQLINSYALKWYEDRRLKKSFIGSNFGHKFGPFFKKNGVYGLYFLVCYLRSIVSLCFSNACSACSWELNCMNPSPVFRPRWSVINRMPYGGISISLKKLRSFSGVHYKIVVKNRNFRQKNKFSSKI